MRLTPQDARVLRRLSLGEIVNDVEFQPRRQPSLAFDSAATGGTDPGPNSTAKRGFTDGLEAWKNPSAALKQFGSFNQEELAYYGGLAAPPILALVLLSSTLGGRRR